ncbi:MAG: ParB/RepB/Spo0J family partition protein [Syntrophomonadaceae bacterium]|nr:ParB/RepB/Spo0J family partition protein [Syntrophomonadaceae bacterium]
MAKPERGLGRGLDALFSEEHSVGEKQVAEIEIKLIHPRKNQPRKNFDPQLLQELSESIRERGVLQPILLRPLDKGYQIVAGERRWRAAKMAGLKTMPALVREMGDAEVAEISLIENLQRDDLSIIEEALAYKNMIEEFDYRQDILSQKIGKSRVHISNTIRLLSLPQEIITLLENKQLTPGHARALLRLDSDAAQIKAARRIADGKLSVRQVEELIRFDNKDTGKAQSKTAEEVDLEERLQKHLGSKVEFKRRRQGGTIEITYFNNEDLERILEIIGLDNIN